MSGDTSAAAGGEASEPRRRDAARTRLKLLAAASELFGQGGFGGTTVREIGERAGVDPALIARYFGSKTALYIATLEHDGANSPEGDGDHAMLDRFIRRSVRLGPNSIVHAAITAAGDDEVREAARRVLDARVIARFERVAEAAGVDDVRLRAELATAVLAGIALCRASGTFSELAAADHDEVVARAEAAIDRLLGVD